MGRSAEGAHRASCSLRSSGVWLRAGIGGARPRSSRSPEAAAREAGLPDPRVTSDAKHVEIGLTDKADSARWIFSTPRTGAAIGPSVVLVAGDEFGPLGGLTGQRLADARARGRGATVASPSAPSPRACRDGVGPLGGGPAAFLALLEDQLARRRKGRRPRDRPRPRLDALGRRRRPAARARPRVAADARRRADRDERQRRSTHHPAASPRPRRAASTTGTVPRRRSCRARCGTALASGSTTVDELRRALDLRDRGCLHEETRTTASGRCASRPVRIARAARARPPCGPTATTALRRGRPALARSRPGLPGAQGRLDGRCPWTRLEAGRGGVVAAAVERAATPSRRRRLRLDRLAAYVADPSRRTVRASARRPSARARPRPRGLRAAARASTARRGRRAGRPPTSRSRATTSCSGPSASRCST